MVYHSRCLLSNVEGLDASENFFSSLEAQDVQSHTLDLPFMSEMSGYAILTSMGRKVRLPSCLK